jgi:gluconate:H+ symporter, GntP family
MAISLTQILLAMLGGIAIILLLTVKFRIHAFFALMAACLVTGLGVGYSPLEIIALIKEGFGNIMKSLSLIIILGTTLGLLLEQNGSTTAMAGFILRVTGHKRPAFAMSITGYITGLPIFCDSAYIVLCGLNTQLARRTGISVIYIAASLATGLLSVHCLVPPHPGITAASITLGVDLGRVIIFGMIVAIPTMLVGHAWTLFAGKKLNKATDISSEEPALEEATGAGLWLSILPVIVPIILIAFRSIWQMEEDHRNSWINFLLAMGDPVIALSIGILLALIPRKSGRKLQPSNLFHDSVEKAGTILMIIGAGGAFGAILASTKMGVQLGQLPGLSKLGLLFPFLLTVLLKTAQGSSTVAVITASTIIQPLLPVIGLHAGNGPLIVVLAMGAGSMIISHANDAYFWVISKFSGIDMQSMLRIYSLATLWMGLTSFFFVYLLSLFLT